MGRRQQNVVLATLGNIYRVIDGIGIPALWTPDLARAWLADAVTTLYRLPAGQIGPSLDTTMKLPVIEEYGRSIATVRIVPDTRAIDRMNFVYPGWILAIADPHTRKATMIRAMGWPWRQIGQRLRCSHEHARKLEARGITEIVQHLNGEANAA